MEQWIRILEQKQTELELIASWASQVNLGKVRDYCREAKFELVEEISRLRKMTTKTDNHETI